MLLSPHFSLSEMTVSETAARRGLKNSPNAAEIDNLELLCTTVLEPLRVALGPIIVTSGFRSEAVNKAAGGSPTSAHRIGLAADIHSPTKTRREIADWLAGHVPFDQVILEFIQRDNPMTGWVHVGLRANAPLRRQRLTAKKVLGKTVYLPGFVA